LLLPRHEASQPRWRRKTSADVQRGDAIVGTQRFIAAKKVRAV